MPMDLFGGSGGSGAIPGLGGQNPTGMGGGSSLFEGMNPGSVPFGNSMGGGMFDNNGAGAGFGGPAGMFGGNQGGGNPVQAMGVGATPGLGLGVGSTLPQGIVPGSPTNTPLNNQGTNGTQGNLLGGSPATLNNILPPGFQGVAETAQNTGFLNIPQIMQGIEASSFPGFEQGMAGLSNLFGADNASFGSEKALGASNMSSQYAASLAGIQSQLYEQQAQNQLGVFNTLEGQEATYKANEATPWDYISGALGIGSSLFGAGGMFGGGSSGGAFGGLFG